MNQFICERCFPHIHEDDTVTFARLLRGMPPETEQWLHTLRELIFGTFLARNGLAVRYERKVEGKTPDWSLLSPDGELVGLLDVVNFHNVEKTERYIKNNLAPRRPRWSASGRIRR